MFKLDQMVEVLLRWFTGGETKYKASAWRDWMPGDYAGEAAPRKRKKTLKQQLSLLAKAYGGNWKA